MSTATATRSAGAAWADRLLTHFDDDATVGAGDVFYQARDAVADLSCRAVSGGEFSDCACGEYEFSEMWAQMHPSEFRWPASLGLWCIDRGDGADLTPELRKQIEACRDRLEST